MEVGWMVRFLMQEGLVLLAAGQLPQYRPVPQSGVEEHEFPTWQEQKGISSGTMRSKVGSRRGAAISGGHLTLTRLAPRGREKDRSARPSDLLL
jgi:hypothetical protein